MEQIKAKIQGQIEVLQRQKVSFQDWVGIYDQFTIKPWQLQYYQAMVRKVQAEIEFLTELLADVEQSLPDHTA